MSIGCLFIALTISHNCLAFGDDEFSESRQSAANATTETPLKLDAEGGCKLQERPGLVKEIRFTAWCETIMSGNNFTKLSTPASNKLQCWSQCAARTIDECLFSTYHPNNNTCLLIPSKVFCHLVSSDLSSTIFSSVRRAFIHSEKYYTETGSNLYARNFPMASTDEWNLDCVLLCEITLNCVMGLFYKQAPPSYPVCYLYAVGSTPNPTTLNSYSPYNGFKLI